MRRNGVHVINNKPKKYKAKFYGERGAFYPKRQAIEITSSCNFKCLYTSTLQKLDYNNFLCMEEIMMNTKL